MPSEGVRAGSSSSGDWESGAGTRETIGAAPVAPLTPLLLFWPKGNHSPGFFSAVVLVP